MADTPTNPAANAENDAAQPAAEKPGFFARLFKSKGDSKPSDDTVANDNVFTKMFKKDNVIDTIVASSETGQKGADAMNTGSNKGLLKLAKGALSFTIAFVAITAVFFYTQNLDTENRVLGMVGIQENSAMRLHLAAQDLADRQTKEADLKSQLTKYESGAENEFKPVIDSIIKKRLNWTELLAKINETIDSVYEKNELSQYVQFTTFNYDAKEGKVRISGLLTDPLGKNLAKQIELRDAFANSPYFSGVNDLSAVSKTLDEKTGRYVSNIEFTFQLKEQN